MSDQQEQLTRREWAVRWGRRTILGGIGALSMMFVARRVNGKCISTGSPCPACLLWEECQLPQAEETRKKTVGSAVRTEDSVQ